MSDLTFYEFQIKKYDTNRTGKIEFPEFLKLYNDLLEDPKLPDDLRLSANLADEEEADPFNTTKNTQPIMKFKAKK